MSRLKSGIDLSSNSKLWPALMAAGFGAMASSSPFPLQAIGQGAQQGVASYAQQKHEETQKEYNKARIEEARNKLNAEVEWHRRGDEIAQQNADTHRKSEESLSDWRTRGNFQKSEYETEDGHPVYYDRNTGQSIDGVTNEPVTGNLRRAPKATTGATESIANRLLDENKKQRKEHPETPEMSFSDALTLAHRAPNDDANNIKLMTRAHEAWKTHTTQNPADKGEKSTIEYWENHYGAKLAPGAPPPAPGVPTSNLAPPGRAPAAAPQEAKVPPGVPPGSKHYRSKKDPSKFVWRAADGSLFSDDGKPLQASP
jgi:hypothetical protein